MAVVRNLMVRIGADLSSLKQGMAQANKEITKFSTGITRLTSGIGMSLGGLAVGQVLTDATKAVMDVENSLMSLSRTMGSSVVDFNDWAKNSASSFNLSTRDALLYGKTFSILLSNISKDGQQNMQMTQNLLQSAAVLSNKHGRSIQDVMERLRSGLMGEVDAIEELGVFVNLSMLKSTNAFKRFAGDRSWDQLDLQTQQLIRYFAILEQTTNTFGATLNDSTSSKVQELSASLDNLRLAIGEVTVPILHDLVPLLTTAAGYFKQIQEAAYQFGYTLAGGEGFAKSYTESVIAINKSLQDQKKPTQDTNNNLQDTIKNMKKLAGFDEINLFDKNGMTNLKNSKTALNASKDAKDAKTNLSKQNDKMTKQKTTNEISPYADFGKRLADYINKDTGSLIDNLKSGKFFINMFEGIGKPFATMRDQILLPTMGNLYDLMGASKYDPKATPVAAPAPESNKPVATPKPVKKPITPMTVNPNMSNTYNAKQAPFVEPNSKTTSSNIKTSPSTTNKTVVPAKPKSNTPAKTTTTTTVTSGPPAGSFMSTQKPAKPKTKLATGGIIDSPTTALIGEAGKELVMPLENTSFTDKVASALGTAVMGAMQMGNNMTGNNGKEIVLKIDGNTIARAINPYLTKESARVGNAIISIS